MTFLLVNKEDKAGLWLYHSLRRRGVANLYIVTAEELVYASYFTCGLTDGLPFFHLLLQNGLVVCSKTGNSFLNRINYLPGAHLVQFIKEDQDYVAQEAMAAFTFLLSVLPNQLFNQASGNGLCGRQRSYLEWRHLASEAGFTTTDFLFEQKQLIYAQPDRDSRKQTVLFFKHKLYSAYQITDSSFAAACLKLGYLSGEQIIEITFHQTEAGCCFLQASVTPAANTMTDDFIADLLNLL